MAWLSYGHTKTIVQKVPPSNFRTVLTILFYAHPPLIRPLALYHHSLFLGQSSTETHWVRLANEEWTLHESCLFSEYVVVQRQHTQAVRQYTIDSEQEKKSWSIRDRDEKMPKGSDCFRTYDFPRNILEVLWTSRSCGPPAIK
jgi:hypothetical protein